MTTYHTRNPLGSTEPKDLFDNAENLDHRENDLENEEWEDRFGRSRLTWHGIEKRHERQQEKFNDDFQQFLLNSGYEDLGDYDEGLVLTSRNQVFRYDDELYRASASLELPYTTTGVWSEESTLFVAVGDGALRQELAQADGASKVGFTGADGEASTLADLAGSVGAAKIGFKADGIGTATRTTKARLQDSISLLDYRISGDESDAPAFTRAFAKGIATGKAVILPGGDYELDEMVSTSGGDLCVIADGLVSITYTGQSTIDVLFRHDGGRLKWSGGRTWIDAQEKAYVAIHCPTYLPVLEHIDFKNTLSGATVLGRNFSGGSFSGSNGVGRGYMADCTAENCGSFTLVAGTGPASDTRFGLLDCETDDQCGFTTNVFNLADLGYGYVRGGYYRGVSSTAPNMTRTKRCEYIGGRYEGMLRGPTVGEDADNVTIVGGISITPSFSGVSIDARKGDNTVPYVSGKVDWTVVGTPSFGVFCQASGINIAALRHVGDGTATSSLRVVRLTDARDVAIGNISSVNAGSSILVQLGSGSAPVPGSSAYKTGDWQSDTAQVLGSVQVNSDSFLSVKPIRTLTSNGDVSPLEDVLFIDASSGDVDVDLPSATEFANVIGKTWMIIPIDRTNDITITRQGGAGSDAPINGDSSYTIPKGGPSYQAVWATCIGAGKYVVSTSV